MDGLGQQWTREEQAFDIRDEWDRAIATVVPALNIPSVPIPKFVSASGALGRTSESIRTLASLCF